MDVLRSKGLVGAIEKVAETGKPIFGICLGMQVLFEESYEFGNQKGIGLIKGHVQRLPEKVAGKRLKVPQIGWHPVSPPEKKGDDAWSNTPLITMKSGSFMHFVHSYYVEPKDNDVIAAQTSYGDFRFCSAISSNNIFACQFHPERSGQKGIAVYENFKRHVHSCASLT
jgi:glutamine amidotransferase